LFKKKLPRNISENYFSIDLFSGCGGLTEGMHCAGFTTKIAVEIDSLAVSAFKLNHPSTKVIQKDIRLVKSSEIKQILNKEPLHLLAGCPHVRVFPPYVA
jgi:DNA (cytosine-5)-methyltransferase 1